MARIRHLKNLKFYLNKKGNGARDLRSPGLHSRSLSLALTTTTHARARSRALLLTHICTMYTDERVYDATAKRSGCCLRSLIVIQEVARYHLHNTWARTKSCIIPSSLARLRYRSSLFIFLFPLVGKKKRKRKRDERKKPCVARVRQSRASARIYARQQAALSASVRSLLRDAYWRRSGKLVRSIRLGRATRRELARSSRPSYASRDLKPLKRIPRTFNRRRWIFISVGDLKNYFYYAFLCLLERYVYLHGAKQGKKDSWKHRETSKTYRLKSGEANLRVENNRRTRRSLLARHLSPNVPPSPLYSTRNQLSILFLFTAVRPISRVFRSSRNCFSSWLLDKRVRLCSNSYSPRRFYERTSF